ncbi:unnamed protein product [Rotaria sp. Silwood1]|nr:unnamed protein product [Rotaria sp. Silwood1]CAF5046577.1 unnamed protein product [Rotaria sp. Silwood1]
MLSGSLATSGACLFTNMSETVKTRVQLDGEATRDGIATKRQYKSLLDAYVKIAKHEGIKGLQAGLGGAIAVQIVLNGLRLGASSALPRVAFGSAAQLSVYVTAKRLLIEELNHPDGMQAHIFASLIASLFSVTLMNPFEVVSTRMYQSAGKKTNYNGMIDCMRKTIQAEGATALQKGWLALYLRSGPHTILTFLFLEKIRSHFLTYDSFCTDAYLDNVTYF